MRNAATVAVKAFSAIPGPVALPLIGSLTTYKFVEKRIEQYHEELLQMYKRYGPIFKETYPLGMGSVVHVFSPEDVRATYASDGRWPHIVPLQSTTQRYRQLKGMNPGLGNLNGEEWYRLRSAVQQSMMKPAAVQEYLPFVNEVSDRLVKHISETKNEAGEVDMRVVAGRWSLESAGLIVFEKRLGALTDRVKWADDLVKLNIEVFKLSAKMRFSVPFYKFFSTPNWRAMVKLEDKFYWEVDKLSTEAIDTLTTGEGNRIKFASQLINKPTLNVNDLKTILLSLFADGLSTTAPTLIYNLYLLAKNPGEQSRLREELLSANKHGEGGSL